MNPLWVLVAASVFRQVAAPRPPKATGSQVSRQQASIALQRESIRKQAQAAGAWMMPFDPAPAAAASPAEPACDPIADAVVSPLIESAAKSQQVEAKLLRAVIEQESAFRPCAVSSKGALGLMQLMPATAQQLDVRDPFDPRASIEGGAKFLKQLLGRYQGDLPQALGAYNAGPGVVDQAGGIPDIPETRNYVDSILAKMGITRTDPPSIPKPKPIEN